MIIKTATSYAVQYIVSVAFGVDSHKSGAVIYWP